MTISLYGRIMRRIKELEGPNHKCSKPGLDFYIIEELKNLLEEHDSSLSDKA